MNFTRAAGHVLFVGALGAPTIYTSVYAYQFLQGLGMMLVVPVGAWIALQIFGIVALGRSSNPFLSGLGEVLGAAFFYTALLQGVVYTTLVFMVLGADTLPETWPAFLSDTLFGMLYLSCFVFGATGLTVLTGMGDDLKKGRKILVKGLAGLGALVTIVGPLVLLLGWGDPFKAWVAEQPPTAGFAVGGYLLVGSIAMMGLFQAASPAPITEGKAKPKQAT